MRFSRSCESRSTSRQSERSVSLHHLLHRFLTDLGQGTKAARSPERPLNDEVQVDLRRPTDLEEHLVRQKWPQSQQWPLFPLLSWCMEHTALGFISGLDPRLPALQDCLGIQVQSCYSLPWWRTQEKTQTG